VTCEIGGCIHYRRRPAPVLQCHMIGQLWGAQGILGVDIDDTLIRGAWKRRRSLWSQQSLGLRLHDPSVVTPKRVKQYHDDDHDYFPASCEHSYGPLPIPSNRTGVAVFPHNVTFRTVDWMTEQDASDESRYDIVLAYEHRLPVILPVLNIV